jgi:hypothetical protein
MQEDVEAGGYVEVRFLQSPSEGKDEGDIVVLGGRGRGGERDGSCGGVGGDPAGEWSIVVDIELQQVK